MNDDMHMNRNLYIIGALLILAVASGVVYGLTEKYRQPTEVTVSVNSIMIQRTVEELTKNSDAAIVGVIEDIAVVKEKSVFRPGESDIVTVATIRVEKYLSNNKGLDSSVIEVRTIGGTVGDFTMVAEDSPSFDIGSRVVVFVYRFSGDDYWVAGDAQGKFTINEDGTLGTEREKPFIGSVFGTENVTLADLEKQMSSVIK